jgi:hypothetical protein
MTSGGSMSKIEDDVIVAIVFGELGGYVRGPIGYILAKLNEAQLLALQNRIASEIEARRKMGMKA